MKRLVSTASSSSSSSARSWHGSTGTPRRPVPGSRSAAAPWLPRRRPGAVGCCRSSAWLRWARLAVLALALLGPVTGIGPFRHVPTIGSMATWQRFQEAADNDPIDPYNGRGWLTYVTAPPPSAPASGPWRSSIRGDHIVTRSQPTSGFDPMSLRSGRRSAVRRPSRSSAGRRLLAGRDRVAKRKRGSEPRTHDERRSVGRDVGPGRRHPDLRDRPAPRPGAALPGRDVAARAHRLWPGVDVLRVAQRGRGSGDLPQYPVLTTSRCSSTRRSCGSNGRKVGTRSTPALDVSSRVRPLFPPAPLRHT